MASNTLTKVNREIKKERRKHPKMTFKQAQKKAWSKYRAGRLGRVGGHAHKRRKSPKRHSRRTISGHKRAVRGVETFSAPRRMINVEHYAGGVVGSVSFHTNQAKRQLEDQLSWLLLQIDQAKGVSQKNKLRKRALSLKRKLRGLQVK